MGEARKRGTFEQRLAMAKERDTVLAQIFAEKDHTAKVVRDAILLTPMTRDRLTLLADRALRMIPG